MTDTVNKVTGFGITLMSGGFGWIELLNGAEISGYIYLISEQAAPEDRLGNVNARDGHPPYVVMHQKFSDAPLLLHILKDVPDLQIRLSGASAFLEKSVSSAASFGEGSALKSPQK